MATVAKENPKSASKMEATRKAPRKPKPSSRKWAFRMWVLGIWLLGMTGLALCATLVTDLLTRLNQAEVQPLPNAPGSVSSSFTTNVTLLEGEVKMLVVRTNQINQECIKLETTVKEQAAKNSELALRSKELINLTKDLKDLVTQQKSNLMNSMSPSATQPEPTDCLVVAMHSGTMGMHRYLDAFRSVVLNPALRRVPNYRIGFTLVRGESYEPICPLIGSNLEKDKLEISKIQPPPSTSTSRLVDIGSKVRIQFPDLGKRNCHCIIVASVRCVPVPRLRFDEWSGVKVDVILIGTEGDIKAFDPADWQQWHEFSAYSQGAVRFLRTRTYEEHDPEVLSALTGYLQRLSPPLYPTPVVSGTKDKE